MDLSGTGAGGDETRDHWRGKTPTRHRSPAPAPGHVFTLVSSKERRYDYPLYLCGT
jgi:hypothetical protein